MLTRACAALQRKNSATHAYRITACIAVVGAPQLIELPVSVVENSPAYKALLQSYEATRKEAAEARAAEVELRRQLDQLLAARQTFIEEMEVRTYGSVFVRCVQLR